MRHTRVLLYLICLSFGVARAASLFTSAQTYAAGFGGATQSVVGDFNGDHVPDIAIVNPCNSSYCVSGYSSVAVIIANGDGTFQSPVPYATGSDQPMSIAAGDFNGDGALDLVVASQCASSANCTNGQVSVFLGNGDGTFQPPVSYSAGSGNSYFVAAGDFNGDGVMDLAVVNQTGPGSSVGILLGNGDGTFQPPAACPTGALAAQFIAIGDFNNDGAPDLAVANSSQDSISILLGNGDGTFQAPQIYGSGGAFAYAIAIGDFNADGAADLAVVNGCASYNNLTCSAGGAVGVLLGRGDGTFLPAVSYASGGAQANSIDVADFDGDGRLDVVVGNAGTNGGVLGILLGVGDGTLQPAMTFATGGNFAAYVEAGDFNGDGQPDVAVVNQCPASGDCTNMVMGVLLNTAGNFQLRASSTALGIPANPAGPNQAVLLTASVPAAATGSVTFYDGGGPLASAPVAGGQASYTASFAAPGAHAIRVLYSGDTNYAPSASRTVSEIVGTSVSLTSSANPVALNQQATFTASLPGTATGTVTFKDGVTLLGTVPLVNGAASVSRALSAGPHSITASYSGDGNDAPGLAMLSQAVSQASSISLTSSANPATINQPVTYTATVSDASGPVASGAVAFTQGATTWATAPVINGSATITTVFPSQGSNSIAAVYLGSPADQTSTSGVLNQTVSGNQSINTTTALITSGTPSYLNQPVTFTATVNPFSGTVPDGETVTFFNEANTLGAGATAGGVATFITSTLPLGTNSITATYAGDGTYQSSTSHTVKQVVQVDPTNTTITSSLNPSTFGQAVTFTVTVAPQSGSGVPTGTVNLKNDGFAFGTITLSRGTGSLSTSTLAAGSLQILASYSGDANYAASSMSLIQVVNVATTSTALTSTPNPSSLNQNVTFTATVTSQYAGNTTGAITFTQGSQVLGSGPPVRGKASVTSSFATTGTFPVVATYSGDVSNSGSASAPLNQVVGATSTTTALATSGTPSFLGQSVTFTATVTPASGSVPNGELVTFYDGSAAIGTGATAGGIATFGTTKLTVGTHSITATYAGDTTYKTSTSKVVKQVVSLDNSVTTLSPSANPATYGQSVTLTATVAAGSGSLVPTGKVAFKNGTTVLASVNLVNGSANYTAAKLTAGSLQLSASYNGDTNFAASSATITEVMNQATTATVVTSYPNPSSQSQSVTFTATVTSQYQGIFSGSASFYNGSKLLGSSALSNGKATFSYIFDGPGSNPMTAVYSGDANNLPSTSPIMNQVVTNAVTTTTLGSSGSPANAGQPVTFTATVSSAFGSIPDGELVTFYDSGATIGTGTTRNGLATFTTSTLTAGIHSVTATYAGDSTYQTSTSAVFKQTINTQATVTVVTSSANPSYYGGPVTFTATVTGAGPIPTGTVTFKNGSTPLGTAALNPAGATTYTTVTLNAGSYAITASYSGDAASAKSTSATLTQVVTPATTSMQLVSSLNPSSYAESVTFTAIVRSPTAFATGTVTFSAGSQNLGSASLVSGAAKLAVTTLPRGSSTVTATYAPSANLGGCSAAIVQTVE